MWVIGRICGVSLKDRIPNEELRRRVGVAGIAEEVRRSRLRWSGHVLRKGETDRVRSMEVEVEGIQGGTDQS